MITRYEEIAADLRTQILTGQLEPGAPIPSENTLMEAYAAARGTVRSAVGRLKAEGRVVAVQGSGTFVRRPGQLPEGGTEDDPESTVYAVAHLRERRARAGTAGATLARELAAVALWRHIAGMGHDDLCDYGPEPCGCARGGALAKAYADARAWLDWMDAGDC